MSARTSFYSMIGEGQNGSDPANLVPDLSNPLHTSTPHRGNTAQANASQEQKSTSGLAGLRRSRENRMGSNATQTAQKDAGAAPAIFRPPTADPHRRSQGQALQRPDTARPFAAGKQQNAGARREASFPPKVMAPTPVKASLRSGHLSLGLDSPENPFDLSGFKVPALPQSREKPATVQVEAHISAGNEPPRSTSRQATRTPDTSMDSISTLVDSSMETTHSFKSQHDGPRRVVLQKTGQHFEADHFPVDFVGSGHIVNDTGRVVQIGGQKRARDPEDDESNVLQAPAKRPRISTGQEERRQQLERSGGGELYLSGLNDRSFAQIPNLASQMPASSQRDPSALDVLLGVDTDAFTRDNMSKYDHLAEKWCESPKDEWVAGANEIMRHFTSLLDYVKDHVASKVKVYATLGQKMDAHTRALDERQTDLDAAQKMYEASQNAIIPS
ncbi:hypothetical protein BKA70DRAFT_1277968 [Coprinopsis sp. MPI-PUGE-AT-0042]|nr:hypothetical protein BKA70DRAFT_1277968 [Coprinopsis sp. MPI-PUGE-AT-0042]